jgi:hypothetical protein
MAEVVTMLLLLHHQIMGTLDTMEDLEDTTMVTMEGDLDTMVIIELYDFYKATFHLYQST